MNSAKRNSKDPKKRHALDDLDYQTTFQFDRKNLTLQRHTRFFIAMILYCLTQEKKISSIVEKFGVNRGLVGGVWFFEILIFTLGLSFAKSGCYCYLHTAGRR